MRMFTRDHESCRPTYRSTPAWVGGRALLVVSVALLVAACGGDDGGSGSDGGTSTGGGSDAAAETGSTGKVAAAEAKLEVVLEGIGSKDGGVPVPTRAACDKSLPASCRVALECPAADDGPADELALCTWLAERGRAALAAPDPDAREVCTMIYGGAETATITGELDGKPVDLSFSRENGCEIARWDAVAPIWTGEIPAATGGAPASADGAGAADASGDVASPPVDAPSSTPGSPPTGTPAAPDAAPQPDVMTDPPAGLG